MVKSINLKKINSQPFVDDITIIVVFLTKPWLKYIYYLKTKWLENKNYSNTKSLFIKFFRKSIIFIIVYWTDILLQF